MTKIFSAKLSKDQIERFATGLADANLPHEQVVEAIEFLTHRNLAIAIVKSIEARMQSNEAVNNDFIAEMLSEILKSCVTAPAVFMPEEVKQAVLRFKME